MMTRRGTWSALTAALALTSLATPGQASSPPPEPAHQTRARDADTRLLLAARHRTTSAYGMHKVYFARLRGPSGAAPVSNATIRTVIHQVDSYYSAISGGKIRFRLARILPGWKTPPRAGMGCHTEGPAWVQRKFGLPLGERVHVVTYRPDSCGVIGVASTPGSHVAINSSATSFAAAHELGHNLGLGHSNFSRCTILFTRSCASAKDDRRDREYGDPSDLMGGADEAQGDYLTPVDLRPLLGPVHLQTLGLLSKNLVTTMNVTKATNRRTIRLTPDMRKSGNILQFRWRARTYYVWYNGERLTATTSEGGPSSLAVPTAHSGTESLVPGVAYQPSAATDLLIGDFSDKGVDITVQPHDPTIPSKVVATPGVSSANVSWVTQRTAGVTGWRLTATSIEQTLSNPFMDPPADKEVTVAGEQTSATLGGLTPGVRYRITVHPVRSGASGSGPCTEVVPTAAQTQHVPATISFTGDTVRAIFAADPSDVTQRYYGWKVEYFDKKGSKWGLDSRTSLEPQKQTQIPMKRIVSVRVTLSVSSDIHGGGEVYPAVTLKLGESRTV